MPIEKSPSHRLFSAAWPLPDNELLRPELTPSQPNPLAELLRFQNLGNLLIPAPSAQTVVGSLFRYGSTDASKPVRAVRVIVNSGLTAVEKEIVFVNSLGRILDGGEVQYESASSGMSEDDETILLKSANGQGLAVTSSLIEKDGKKILKAKVWMKRVELGERYGKIISDLDEGLLSFLQAIKHRRNEDRTILLGPNQYPWFSLSYEGGQQDPNQKSSYGRFKLEVFLPQNPSDSRLRAAAITTSAIFRAVGALTIVNSRIDIQVPQDLLKFVEKEILIPCK